MILTTELIHNDHKEPLSWLAFVNKPDFWLLGKTWRKLTKLHVDYEEVVPFEDVKVSGTQHSSYPVQTLKFVKKGGKSTIICNENIPEKAYEYVVNGKSAIGWIIDRYQIKTDKTSGIINDLNDWAKDVGNFRYILDLLLSVINVSVQTVAIVNALPKQSFETEEND